MLHQGGKNGRTQTYCMYTLMHELKLAHTHVYFSPQKAPQGGSTVLKKIFPKALITKTMVLVNSRPPHAHTTQTPPSPLHLTLPQFCRKRRRKTQKKQNKKDSGKRRRERSTGRPGSGPYLPTAALLALPYSTEHLPSEQKPDLLALTETHTHIHA